MGIDRTSNPTDDDGTPASASDSGDQTAEQAGGQQTGPDDDRGHQRAETLTREEYADAMRADGPPIRQESPDAFHSPRGSGSDGQAGIEEVGRTADRDTTAWDDGDAGDGHAGTVQDESDRDGFTTAELSRSESGNQIPEASDGPSAEPGAAGHESDVGHEPEIMPAGDAGLTEPRIGQEAADETGADGDGFKGETRGEERAEADRADAGVSNWLDRFSVVEAERTLGDTTPTGISLKPTGEQILDMEGDTLSRADRFRKNVYERADDIKDVTEKTAGTLQGLLGAHRPTGHEVAITAEPAAETPPPQPLDAGSIATAGLVVGLLADRAIHWAREWLRRPKG
jgi:hypothetical protein